MERGPISLRRLAGWAPVVAGWALLTGMSLALRPLMPVDETRYAAVAWEMWTRGDFLVPHLNALPYSDKPPLLFWLIHFGWWTFGVNEWWPRLVPALFSLLNLGLASALARRLWPDRPSVVRSAPRVLLGLLLWSAFTGMLMFDMLVTCCVLLALLGLHGAWARGGALAWFQVGAALGLGILAKGPVALLAPLLTALLAPWWGHRRADWRWWLGLAAAVAFAAAIALCWALPAARAGGPAYGDAILFSQTEERVVHSFAHLRPWWWYLPLLPVLLYPYSFWPPLWKAAVRLRPRAADSGVRFCLAWTLPALAAFSLISGKQPHYLLPLFPGFALLAARLLEEPVPEPTRWSLVPSVAVLLLVAAVLSVAPVLAHRPGIPPWAAQILPAAGVLLGLAALAVLFLPGRFFAGRPAAPALLSLLLMAALYTAGSGAIRRAYDVAPMARYLAAIQRRGQPIAYVGEYHGEFHFLGRLQHPLEQVATGAEWRWLVEHPDGKLVELASLPLAKIHADFAQPYRSGVLAVWSRDSFPSFPSGAS